METSFLTLTILVVLSGYGRTDYVSLIQLASTIYTTDPVSTAQALAYLSPVRGLLQIGVETKDEYLADIVIEVTHIADYVISKLEENQYNENTEMMDIGQEMVNITELQLQGISHVTCRSGQTVGCSLSALLAVPLVNATEECLLRVLLLIVSSPFQWEVDLQGTNLSAVATQIPMYAITSRPRICNILSVPALNDDAFSKMSYYTNIYIFVLASTTNMYAFLDEATHLNSGTVRSFARDYEGRLLELFKEINLFIEALYNPWNKPQKEVNPAADVSTGLNITTDIESDTDAGSLTIRLATIQQCTTYVQDTSQDVSFHVQTFGTDIILQDTSSNLTQIQFADQVLSMVMFPPVKPMQINVLCASCMQKADIVFLVDSSGSVGPLNFLKILSFMHTIVGYLDVASDRVRVGLVTYETEARLQFHLDAYNNSADVTAAIDQVGYQRGPTNTHLGLEFVRLNMFPPDPNRIDVQKLVIVVTDGISEDTYATIAEADKLRGEVVEIAAIAVGSGADMDEINAIANDPDEYFTFVAEFTDLYNLSTQVIHTICKSAWKNVSTDGHFGLLAGYTMDVTTMAWTKSPALQLKSMEENAAVFKSNFFGTFGFDLFADAPELINFEEVFTDFDKKIADNPFVLAANCILVGALLVGSVILRWYDKKDEDQWHYKPLDDNPDDADHVYFISVHTGLWSSSVFTSTSYVILEGMAGSSDIRALKAGSVQNLFRWKYANFALGTHQTLGPLVSVKIWHDDPDQAARLYVDKVLIADGYTGTKYVFLCDQWLASDRSDGCTYRTLYPAEDELQDGKTLFKSVTRFNFFDEYLWLSMFGRPSFSRFNRVQRLYCISALLSLSMLGSAMWFNTGSDKPSYGVKLGFFELNYKQIYVGVMSSLISFPAAVIIAMIFRNRRFRSESQNKGMDKYKKDITFNANQPSAPLPWFFVFVGYGLAAGCLASGTFFTTLYSIQWGEEISQDWLLSILFGAGSEMAFMEPIKTVVLSLVLACLFKGLAKKSLSEMAPFQIDKSLFGNGALANPSKWPGDRKDTAAKALMKQQMLLDRRLFTHIRGFLGEFLYIAVLVLICSHNVVQEAYLQNRQLVEQLKPVKAINTTEDIWNWLNSRYADKVFPKIWYDGDPRLPPERKYMDDGASYRMGPVRLRQKRVIGDIMTGATCEAGDAHSSATPDLTFGFCEGKCDIPDVMKNTLHVCPHDYQEEFEDTAGYCPEWTKYQGSCDESGFTYLSGNTTSALTYSGIFGTYSGGGYVKDINPFKAEVTHEINKLYKKMWIDNQTRFVVVENMVFNPNSRLFSLVSIVFEFPSMGGIFMTTKAQSARLYPYVNVWDFLVLGAQGIFILITFISGILLVYDVWNLKIRCLTSLNFLGKFVSVGFAVAAVVMYVIRIDRTVYIVEEIMNSAEKFLSFEIVVQYDDIYKMCISVVLFISILMLLKPLTFNYYLYMMKTSILVAKQDLLSFGVILGIAITAFACLVHLYIGSTSFSFRTISSSYLTLFRTLLAMVRLREMVGSADGLETELIFTIFIFTMTLILINMFISILNDAFGFVKDGKNAGVVAPFDAELNKHFWWKIEQAFNCGGAKKPKHAKPKKDEGFSALDKQIDMLSDILFAKSREEANENSKLMSMMHRR